MDTLVISTVGGQLFKDVRRREKTLCGKRSRGVEDVEFPVLATMTLHVGTKMKTHAFSSLHFDLMFCQPHFARHGLEVLTGLRIVCARQRLTRVTGTNN